MKIQAIYSLIQIPIVITAAFSTGAAAVTPAAAGRSAVLSTLPNHANLMHQTDITIGGVVAVQVQPYVNNYLESRMLSETSQDDLEQLSRTIGFSDLIDYPDSVIYNNINIYTAKASTSGNGVYNNILFSTNASTETFFHSRITAAQNTGAINHALPQRTAKIVDITQVGCNKIYGGAKFESYNNNRFAATNWI